MKKVILFILIIIIYFNSISIAKFGNSKSRSQNSWKKTFFVFKRLYSIQHTKDKSYIISGNNLLNAWVLKINSEGHKEWDYTLDDSYVANSVLQTLDGGYILAGSTSTKGAGEYDFLVFKIDEKGRKIGESTFGGSKNDFAKSIKQTADGGYIVVGITQSKGYGDAKKRRNDVWVIKLNNEGFQEWDYTFGGKYDDLAESIQLTNDNGYIIAGSTCSKGNKFIRFDAWIIKLSRKGHIQWEYTFGGDKEDKAYDIKQTTDGGFIVSGSKNIERAKGDAWVFKLNNKGKKQWDYTYDVGCIASSIQQTTDNGYIVAGSTYQEGNYHNGDVLVMKLNNKGNKQWHRTFGENDYYEIATSILQTADGGYIFTGYADKVYDNTDNFKNDTNAFIIKVNSEGLLIK